MSLMAETLRDIAIAESNPRNLSGRAIDRLSIVWNAGHTAVPSSSIARMLDEGLETDDPYVGAKNGDAQVALTSAASRVMADYAFPYQAQAP